MKTALVCIAKNEDHYIDEWIDYHLSIGFSDVFVYENNWRCTNEKAIKIPWDGEGMQVKGYNNFIENNTEYDWVAFFDVDEFLVLKKHKNIADFLKDYSFIPAVGVNWVLFGDSGLPEPNGDYSVMKRFTKRQRGVNIHIKSIVNLKTSDIQMQNPHYTNTGSFAPDGIMIIGAFNYTGNDEIVQLNHYFCKTRPEFLEKVNRGRANFDNGQLRDLSDFDAHNFNEI